MIVIKLGGSILREKNFNNIYEYIKYYIKNNEKLIIVVSAMGRKGDCYSTYELEKLSPNLNIQEKDAMISLGEIISEYTFASFIKGKKINCKPVTIKDISLISDDIYGDANLLSLDKNKFKEYFEEYDCIIVPGFQALTITGGNIATLGRGGSDTTALYLATELNANKVVIISDTLGLYSDDPKKDKDATFLHKVNYSKLIEVLKGNTQFLHNKAFELALKSRINIEFRGININDDYTEVSDEF